MELLEKGPGWSIIGSCTGKGNGGGGCGSRWLLKKEDIYLTSHTDYIGDTDYYYTFRCSECGAETDIPSRDIPYSIRSELLNYKFGYTRRREWR